MLFLVLLLGSNIPYAQVGIFFDSVNAALLPVPTQLLKANRIKYVHEHDSLQGGLFRYQTHFIDTNGNITKRIWFGRSGQQGNSIDSLVYDEDGRKIAEYTINIKGKRETMSEFHFRYPKKDSIESRGYHVNIEKDIIPSLSFTRFDPEQRSIEIKGRDKKGDPTFTRVFSYNADGSLAWATYTDHQYSKISDSSVYQYHRRSVLKKNARTGQKIFECIYNKTGQCTSCTEYWKPSPRQYKFRYDEMGLLYEIAREYIKDGRRYTITKRFQYER